MAEIIEIPALKAISALLLYPSDELVESLHAIESLLDGACWEKLLPLMVELGSRDLYELQERYVELFDRSRGLSLHLFEHVHGEGRDRGQAMVDLAALYRAHGLDPAPHELPDYLPLFLEYVATRPQAEAQGLLADIAHILALLEGRLMKRQSPYAALFAVLGGMAGPVAAPPEMAPVPEVAHDDLAALDAAWEESAVTFGPGDALGGCPAACSGGSSFHFDPKTA